MECKARVRTGRAEKQVDSLMTEALKQLATQTNAIDNIQLPPTAPH